jgi:predicted transcriptional regulator
MKNVTLSADEALIDRAILVARSQHRSLNAAFREWLSQYAAQSGSGVAFDALMHRLADVQPGRHFTRDEMNER